MDLSANSLIKEAENAYVDAQQHVTDTALEVEKNCNHSIWCGRDSSAMLDAIYICLHCRMEIHINSGHLLNLQRCPEPSIVLSEKQCRVNSVTSLRIQGDQRGYIRLRSDFFDAWPVRPSLTNIPAKDD